MNPTEILSSEHRVLERVLDVLDVLGRRARERKAIDLEAAKKVLRFLRTFADDCHHGKEEKRLFPMIERRGLPRHAGPVAVMLHEHEVGRAAIRALASALEAGRRGDARAPDEFAFHAGEYTLLLREHIAKEDQVLFPLAESVLTEADRAELLRQFAEAEEQEMGAGFHEEMLALADALCAEFQVAPPVARPVVHACGHGKH